MPEVALGAQILYLDGCGQAAFFHREQECLVYVSADRRNYLWKVTDSDDGIKCCESQISMSQDN